jgi:flagellar motor switch protein FliG
VAPSSALSGTRKAAILVMALGEEASSLMFQHLQEEEIEKIAKEIATLGPVSSETGEKVLEEFHQLTDAANYVTHGGVDYARRLLQRSFSKEDASRILDRVVRSFKTSAGFATLEKTDPQQLSKFILAEHPQTIALILAHLNSTNAAQLVSLLPDALRADVMIRMANLDEISPEVIQRISAVIESRLKTVGGLSREQHGGVRAVAELCNRLDRSVSQSVLDTIEGGSPDLAVSIRNLMFVFEDLQHVEDNGLREIIQRVDKKILAIALKGAPEDIRTRFLANMSKRAAEMLKEEIEAMGAVRMREVEKAQHEVVSITRKLEEEGVITTGAVAGEAYVV